MATRVSVRYGVNGSFGSLAGVTYLCYTVLTSSNKSQTAAHFCNPALSVLAMLVSRNVFSRSISLAVCCLYFIPYESVWDVTDCTKTCRASEGREKALRWRSIPAGGEAGHPAPSFVRKLWKLLGSIGK